MELVLRDLGVGKWRSLFFCISPTLKTFYHNIEIMLSKLVSSGIRSFHHRCSFIASNCIIHTHVITSRLLWALFAVFFHYCTVYPLLFVFLYIAYPLSGVTLIITRTLGVFPLHWSLFMLFCQQGTTSKAELRKMWGFPNRWNWYET